jgi:hypothetical protein
LRGNDELNLTTVTTAFAAAGKVCQFFRKENAKTNFTTKTLAASEH